MNAALERLRKDGSFLALYTQGMSYLFQSGVFEALRENGRVSPVSPELQNYEQYQAAIANWSLGYNTAIDQLLYFRELFLDAQPNLSAVKMDFGALDLAVSKGDLTKDEADAIRQSNSTNSGPTEPL